MLTSFRTGHVLWHISGARAVIVLGNSTENETLWCADHGSLESVDIALADLESKPELEPHDWKNLVRRMEARGAEGDSQALWWAAWAWEGMNHPKSVWYYIAAMRCNPRRHGWALDRVYSDARYACMQEGVPKPSIAFMKHIEEFNGAKQWGRWQDAVEQARKARHRPLRDQSPKSGPRVVKLSPQPDNG